MVIRVKLPTGQFVKFPDNTPDDVMNNAINQRLGTTQPQAQEQPGFFQNVEETAIDVGKSFATGLAELPLNVGAFAADIAGVTDGEAVAPPEGVAPSPDEGINVKGRISQALGFLGNPMEFVQNAELRKELLNTSAQDIGNSFKNSLRNVERIQKEAAERSPIAAPAAELTGQIAQFAALPFAGAARGAKGVVGGGILTGQALGALQTDPSQDLTSAESLERRAETGAVGALAGGVLPIGIQKAIQSSPALLNKAVQIAQNAPAFVGRGLSKLAQINPQAANDFATLETANALSLISDSPAIKLFDRFLSGFPGGAGIINKNADKILGEIQGNINKLGADKAVTIQEAGNIIKEGGTRFIQRFNDVSTKLYNRLDKIIPKNTKLTLNNTTELLNKTTKNNAPGILQSLRQGGGLNVLENIANDLQAGAPLITSTALRGEGQLSYQATKNYRSMIGRKLSTSHLVSGEQRALLKQVYASLTQDMRSVFQAKGDKALKSFDRVNDFFKRGTESIEKTLRGVIEKDAPGQVFKAATEGTKLGDFRVSSIMKKLSSEEREIVRGTVLRDLGLATPGQQGAAGNTFSMNSFLTNWNKLSPEAKTSLFGAQDKVTRKSLDKIADQGERLKGINRFANPSGTGQNLTMGALFGGVFGIGKTVAAILGANVSARLITNKNFVNLLGKWATEKPTPRNMSKFLTQAKDVVDKNPQIADDVSKYITTLSIISGNKNGS